MGSNASGSNAAAWHAHPSTSAIWRVYIAVKATRDCVTRFLCLTGVWSDKFSYTDGTIWSHAPYPKPGLNTVQIKHGAFRLSLRLRHLDQNKDNKQKCTDTYNDSNKKTYLPYELNNSQHWYIFKNLELITNRTVVAGIENAIEGRAVPMIFVLSRQRW